MDLYGYCINDPVNAIDPEGKNPLLVLLGLGLIADIALNIEYDITPCGDMSVNISPPSMFTKGFPLPLFFGVNVPIGTTTVPLIGEIGYPTAINITADPRIYYPNNNPT